MKIKGNEFTMKLCTNCTNYSSDINYCSHFKFKVNSISSASICCKYEEPINTEITKSVKEIEVDAINAPTETQADSLITTLNKTKRSKKNQGEIIKCINCKNLFFKTFCSSQNKNILNPNKPIRCEHFKLKSL